VYPGVSRRKDWTGNLQPLSGPDTYEVSFEKMWVNWVPGAMEDEVKQTTKHFVSAWNKS
jgi:hypothetical protein